MRILVDSILHYEYLHKSICFPMDLIFYSSLFLQFENPASWTPSKVRQLVKQPQQQQKPLALHSVEWVMLMCVTVNLTSILVRQGPPPANFSPSWQPGQFLWWLCCFYWIVYALHWILPGAFNLPYSRSFTRGETLRDISGWRSGDSPLHFPSFPP